MYKTIVEAVLAHGREPELAGKTAVGFKNVKITSVVR